MKPSSKYNLSRHKSVHPISFHFYCTRTCFFRFFIIMILTMYTSFERWVLVIQKIDTISQLFLRNMICEFTWIRVLKERLIIMRAQSELWIPKQQTDSERIIRGSGVSLRLNVSSVWRITRCHCCFVRRYLLQLLELKKKLIKLLSLNFNSYESLLTFTIFIAFLILGKNELYSKL